MADVILELDGVKKQYPVYGRLGHFLPPVSFVRAMKDVSFTLREGETYGLVGESGSGKTTTGRVIAGLTGADGGRVLCRGEDLLRLSKKGWKRFRRDIQFIFQDPFSSLDPRKRAGKILEESLVIHRMGGRDDRRRRVLETLELVGLQPEHYFRYPHEFSGGQRQRLALARALIISPKIIICDEPVSALDVSIQSQMLNTLKSLQREMKLSLIFITHDIRVVRHISDRVGVMYLGSIVEEAATDAIFASPRHPYTRSLFSAVPDFFRNRLSSRIILRGEIPSFTEESSGCVFRSRCPRIVAAGDLTDTAAGDKTAADSCASKIPALELIGTDHFCACHHAQTGDYAAIEGLSTKPVALRTDPLY
ncbi:MAG: ATP-binding cassette domain-containing protein [Spirochaetaceae bacterium]|jgi:oligopeptide transport system ATP-binding protein|nr:ATP-binding cassette domain-containing protein [Spirochaetaceae bacterium]